MCSVAGKKTITLVAAMARNRAIGLNGRMPWHLPAELQHFKRVTMGKPIVMGRKTWESLGRPLPGRQNIVVTRQAGYRADGVDVANALEQAIDLARGPEVMLIGGGELYRQALPLATRMVLTLVDCAPDADTWFPEWRPEEWRRVDSEAFEADERNPLAYQIVEWLRVSA
jgi:dihydrofolate reductase